MKLDTLTGKKAHVWQRLSALYLLIYLPLLAWQILTLPAHESLKDLAHSLILPHYLFPSLVAIFLLGIHSWVGLRDILIDYMPRNRTLFWLWGLRGLLILLSLDLVWLLLQLLFLSQP